MKKIKKVFLSLALVLVMAIPMLFMTGCDLSDLFGESKEAKLSNIAVTGNIKTEYYVGDLLNLQNGKLLLRYEDDTEKEITLTSEMISGFDTSTAGDKTMVVSYKEKQTTAPYRVKENLVTSIALTKAIKTEYCIGDTIDFNGAKLLVTYENQSQEKITLTTAMVSNFSTTTIGKRTLTITYEGEEVDVEYTVRYKFTSCNWCVSELHITSPQVINVTLPAIPMQYSGYELGGLSSYYFTFNDDGTGVMYVYNGSSGQFEKQNDYSISYRYKENSLTELIVTMTVNQHTDIMEITFLSETKIKLVNTSSYQTGYYILLKDYYIDIPLVGHKWCASKMVDSQGEHIYPTTPTTYQITGFGDSGYFEFYLNGKGCLYSYNGADFVSLGEFDYNVKEDSTHIVEIKNLSGLTGNNTTIEILSGTEFKMMTDTNGHYGIFTMDYYNI